MKSCFGVNICCSSPQQDSLPSRQSSKVNFNNQNNEKKGNNYQNKTNHDTMATKYYQQNLLNQSQISQQINSQYSIVNNFEDTNTDITDFNNNILNSIGKNQNLDTINEQQSETSRRQSKINYVKNPVKLEQEQERIMIMNDGKLKNEKKTVNLSDFQVIKVLGKGSFGKVFLVKWKVKNKHYAMKILKKESIEKRNQKSHTKSERKILESMESPFIVQLHYAFQSADKLYLVMDFMKGGELFFHLRKAKKFDEYRAKFYVSELILALETLHKRDIIYRDLKPENILLDDEGHIKICDFGLSKLGVTFGEKTHTFCGTPEYLAPEILLGMGHDKSVDWWSLGALLYEMLTGAPPYYSKDKYQMFKNVLEKPIQMKSYFSQEAISLLQGLLTINPEKRLGSSQENSLELKQHPFFDGINWDLMAKKAIPAPFRPDKTALNNFDPLFTDEFPKCTPTINTNEQGMKNDYYSNFTYIKNNLTHSSEAVSKFGDESNELINQQLKSKS